MTVYVPDLVLIVGGLLGTFGVLVGAGKWAEARYERRRRPQPKPGNREHAHWWWAGETAADGAQLEVCFCGAERWVVAR